MNYEIAKKLKDAGLEVMNCQGCDNHFFGEDGGDWIHNPTLSELIDACGNSFSKLHRIDNGFMATGGGKDPTGLDLIHVYGLTLEEAVALLYLELTKHK